MTPDNNYNTIEAVKAQHAYCDEIEAPYFAPSDGRCYHCGANIYRAPNPEHNITPGISVKEASTRLVTGCPFCHYSFVE
jgi:hypothetical protein